MRCRHDIALLVLLAACAPGKANVGEDDDRGGGGGGGGWTIGPGGGTGDDGGTAATDGGGADGGAADGGAADGGAGDGGVGDGGGTEPSPTPTSCADLAPGEPSGVYLVDVDGDGGVEPFEVTCDMDTDGGGWTVWWWAEAGALGESAWSSARVLGDELWDCDPGDGHCFARLPTDEVEELLVVGDEHWASWTFEAGNSTSEAALAAFTDGRTTSYDLDRYGDAWNPSRQSEPRGGFPANYACNSPSTYSGDGRGCANFWYEDSAERNGFNLDDDGGYAQTAFAAGADNNGYRGVDAFETDDEQAHNSRNRSLRMAWR